jgi:ribosomal protein L37AE/L43A
MLTPRQIDLEIQRHVDPVATYGRLHNFARAIEDKVRKQDTELIRQMLAYIESITCTHENTHRGGIIWEICDDCGAQWAIDRGGKPLFKWPDVVKAARARLENT